MAITCKQVVNALGNHSPYDGTSATFTSTLTNGNLLVAVVYWIFSGTPINISDTDGNTWAAATSTAETGNFNRVRMFYAISSLTGTTPAVNISASGVPTNENIELVILEYSGTSSTGQPEANAISTAADNNCAVTSTSDHALVVAASTSSAAVTAGSGYTSRYSSAPLNFEIVVDKVDATPAGSNTAQFSSAGTQAKVAAVFKPTSAGVSVKQLLTLSVG